MYIYEHERKKLFSDEGQKLFIKIRDQVNRMLDVAGAVRMGHATQLPPGIGAEDGWTLNACVDRMVELHELVEIPTHGRGQDRIFRRPSP